MLPSKLGSNTSAGLCTASFTASESLFLRTCFHDCPVSMKRQSSRHIIKPLFSHRKKARYARNGLAVFAVSFVTIFPFAVPPVNMNISKKIIDVIVDNIPESVECTAVAEPEPMFRWFREGSTEVISTDAVHVFTAKVPRRSNGTYICQAHNRHGENNITTQLNVLCRSSRHFLMALSCENILNGSFQRKRP